MADRDIRRSVALVTAGSVLASAGAALADDLAALTGPPALLSQQQTSEPGKASPRLAFKFSSGVNADTNRSMRIGGNDPATTLDTNVGLTYSARTALQSFDASLGALWRLGDAGSSGGNGAVNKIGLQQPKATLAYGYDDGETKLTFRGRYRKSPVNLFEPLTLADGTVSPSDVLATTGSVLSWGAKMGIETGIHDPIGFLFSASTDRRHYLDNTDPNVYDSNHDAASATLRIRPDTQSHIDLIFAHSRQRYQNLFRTNRNQDQLSLGYQRALSPVLTLQGAVGYSRNRSSEIISNTAVHQDSSGLFGSLGLTRALANGTASAQIASERDSYGLRNSLEIGRSLRLPTGKLDMVAGVSNRPGYGSQLIGSMSYELKGPVDSLAVSLSRNVTLDANDNDVAYTSLRLGYDHKLTPIASLKLSVTANHAGNAGLGAAQGVDRQTLGVAYSYQLTPDWDLDAGYLFRHLTETGTGHASSNSVYFTIGRSFTLLP